MSYLFELDEPFDVDGVWTVITFGKNPGRGDDGYQDIVLRVFTDEGKKPIVSMRLVCYMFLFIAMNENGLYPRPEFTGDGKFRKGIQVGLEAGFKAITAYMEKERGSMTRRA